MSKPRTEKPYGVGRGKPRTEKPCTCARCAGSPTANQQYGYDEAKVAETPCLECGQPIGAEPYERLLMLARFGSMMFLHTRCKERTA